MRFINLLPMAFSMLAQLAVATPAPLGKRQCNLNGCECLLGNHPGQYCWGCEYVTKGGSDPSVDYRGWIYECAPDGRCCTYGSRDSCTGDVVDPCRP